MHVEEEVREAVARMRMTMKDPVEQRRRFYPDHIPQKAGKADQVNECAECGMPTPPGRRLCEDCELERAIGEG